MVLLDQAPQTPYEKVRGVLEEELGKSFEDLFERFDVKPLGSASVAQVCASVKPIVVVGVYLEMC